MSIRTRLLIIVLAFTAIPALFVGILSFSKARTALEDAQLAKLENIADLKADKIETFFYERRGDVAVVQSNLVVRNTLPVLRAFADEPDNPAFAEARADVNSQLIIIQRVYEYANIILVTPEGKVVYTSQKTEGEYDLLDAPADLTAKALQKGKKGLCFSDVFESAVREHDFEMLATAPIHDLSDSFVGLIVIVIDMNPIYDFIQNTTGLGQTGETLIGRKQGEEALFLNPLRHDPDAALSRKAVFGEKSAFPIQEALRGRNGSGLSIDYRGKEVIAAWRHLPSMDWGMVAKIDTTEAFTPVSALKKLTFMLEIMALVLGALVALSITKSISSPIHALQRGAEMIGSGNLDYRVGTNSKDEIGQLSRTFDHMTERLAKSTEELKEEIDERKQTEKALKQRTAELEAANKELESFAYTVSHDLRAPLRSMDGFSQALLDDCPGHLGEQGEHYLQRIRAGSQRMARLIDDLLTLSQVTRRELEYETIDLSVMAKKIAKQLHQSQSKRQVKFVITPGLVAHGDENLLQLAIGNLIDNAWKFTSNHAKAQIEFGASEDNGNKVFFIRDDGAGFDMAYADQLFGAFQRLHTPNEFEGTGIGLATVQRVIHRHGGRIWGEGAVEQGATFYFTL